MSAKYLALLFIFLFNFVATSLADSTHIEIEMHDTATEHTHSHDPADIETHEKHSHSSSENSAEHCDEHEGCHSNHYHEYLVSSEDNLMASSLIVSVNFAEISPRYKSNFLDIIKPPLI